MLRYCSLVVLIIMVNLRSPFEEEIPALTNVCHTISKKTLPITNIPFANCLKWKEMMAKTEHETSRNGILKLVCLRKFSSAWHIHVTYREAHSAFSRLWRNPPLFFPMPPFFPQLSEFELSASCKANSVTAAKVLNS